MAKQKRFTPSWLAGGIGPVVRESGSEGTLTRSLPNLRLAVALPSVSRIVPVGGYYKMLGGVLIL